MSAFMPGFGFTTMNLVGALLWLSVQYSDLKSDERVGDA
jgi:hypothetical protein